MFSHAPASAVPASVSGHAVTTWGPAPGAMLSAPGGLPVAPPSPGPVAPMPVVASGPKPASEPAANPAFEEHASPSVASRPPIETRASDTDIQYTTLFMRLTSGQCENTQPGRGSAIRCIL